MKLEAKKRLQSGNEPPGWYHATPKQNSGLSNAGPLFCRRSYIDDRVTVFNGSNYLVFWTVYETKSRIEVGERLPPDEQRVLNEAYDKAIKT